MGKLAQRTHWRQRAERLLARAELLAPADRALLNAHFNLGLTVRQVALLHRVSPRLMRRRIERLGSMLTDPCFLLAAKYAPKLPAELGPLARGYWMQGRPLRELAALRGETLHAVRRNIALIRSLLLLQMAGEQTIPPGLAQEALDGRYVER